MENEEAASSKQTVYDRKKGPNAENVRLGMPDRWEFCPKIGKLVCNRFLPFKTPLCSLYDNQFKDKKLIFHPQDVFNSKQVKGRKIGLWVDFTKTDRFYFVNEVEKNGCKYRKIKLAGHKESPQKEEVEQFIRLCSGFFSENPDGVVAVHCTHGFNRTGFCIISYLVQVEDWALDAAVREFAACRPTGIYKQDYINDLFERYDVIEEAIEAPPKPRWEYGEESYEQEDSGQSTSTDGQNGNGSAVGHAKSGKVFADGKLPEVQVVPDEGLKRQLRNKIKDLCKFHRDGFPGSQPVSMEKSPARDNVVLLAQRRYMVSWKADGSRYLIYILDQGQVYAFDRDNEVFLLPRLTFPHKREPRHIRNTLVDCELIFDLINGVETPRILIYDIISYEGVNLGKERFDRRIECMKKEIIEGRERAAQAGRLHKERELCSVRVKDFWPVEQTAKVLSPKFTQNVGHEIDGLIFQPVDEVYVPGRCDTVLKWKPPSHNSIDFKLQIRKVTKEGELPQHIGFLYVQHSNEPIAQMKATRTLLPYDGKIIECRYDKGEWIFMRERTDKSLPNALKTAQAVFNSMQYPVSSEDLCAFIASNAYHGPPQHVYNPLLEQEKAKEAKRKAKDEERGDREKRPRRDDVGNGREERDKDEDIDYDEQL